MRVALLDYGVGNLHSLTKALVREGAGSEVRVTRDWDDALQADALVLPGVGAFAAAVAALPADPEPIRDALAAGLPCLGICLGMQLLFDASDEGQGRGLGLIAGRVRRLGARVVPQMGWNDVEVPGDEPLFRGATPLVAYYANSYVCEPDDPAAPVAWTDYESERLVAAVRSGNTWGVQFHPEKSSSQGQRLIGNFLTLAAGARRRSPAP
jgi:glutamine amidotransferase